MPKLGPWGHVSRHCIVCGKVGPRTFTRIGYSIGYAHKRCIPKTTTAKCPARKLETPPKRGSRLCQVLKF